MTIVQIMKAAAFITVALATAYAVVKDAWTNDHDPSDRTDYDDWCDRHAPRVPSQPAS